jgi:NitT/TauT family transport system permease protein
MHFQESTVPTTDRLRSAVVVFIGFLILWEAGVRFAQLPAYLLPAPSAILLELSSDPLWYAKHALFTVGTCVFGFGLACIVGVLAAVGIVYSRILENTLYTLLVTLNSVPKIALAPLFIIWMGTGISSKVAISMTIALFAVVIDTVLGLRSADPDALDMARSMRATPLQILWKIRFPVAMPSMFAGMKVAISLALVGAIAGEFVSSEQGLGYVILVAEGSFKTTRVFAAIFLLGVLGTILFYLIDQIERWVIPWHVSHRGIVISAGAADG